MTRACRITTRVGTVGPLPRSLGLRRVWAGLVLAVVLPVGLEFLLLQVWHANLTGPGGDRRRGPLQSLLEQARHLFNAEAAALFVRRARGGSGPAGDAAWVLLAGVGGHLTIPDTAVERVDPNTVLALRGPQHGKRVETGRTESLCVFDTRTAALAGLKLNARVVCPDSRILYFLVFSWTCGRHYAYCCGWTGVKRVR